MMIPATEKYTFHLDTGEGLVAIRLPVESTLEGMLQTLGPRLNVPSREVTLFNVGGEMIETAAWPRCLVPGPVVVRMVNPDAAVMDIRVRWFPTGELWTLQMRPWNTEQTIKGRLHCMTGVEVDRIRTLFAGKVLQEGCTFAEYNIQHQTTINVIARTWKPEGVGNTASTSLDT